MAERRGVHTTVFSAAAIAVAVFAVLATWRRLFIGMDLQDEGFYVLVPWRWVLGFGPFSEEQDVFQIPALLQYPFFKVFGVITGNDPTGLVLYGRHLYLAVFVAVAVLVFLLLRRLVRWELALLAAVLSITYIFWATPQLSYNTMALAFLTLAGVFGAWAVVLDAGRRLAFASGVSLGLAVVAYPTLLFVVPFWAVFLAFACGERMVATISGFGVVGVPRDAGRDSGRRAWRILSGWAAGGAIVLVPVGILLLSFGPGVLLSSVATTMEGAEALDQLGGGAKAIDVVAGLWRFVVSRPYLIVAGLLIYLVYRRWPRLGRLLLAATPIALWLAAQRPLLWASGYAIVFAFLAPYLFLFVPRSRRIRGAQLLVCVWAPAMIAGAMTAYTSAAGYVNSAVGFASTVFVSALFLAWTLEGGQASGGGSEATGARRGHSPWVAFAVLALVVALTVGFQFQFQQRDVPYEDLIAEISTGPWKGIRVTSERAALIAAAGRDIAGQEGADDSLIVLFGSPGYYLFWRGPTASNTLWLSAGPEDTIPEATIAYMRANQVVPTVVLRLQPPAGRTEADLTASTGGLDYPPAVVRASYFLARKPQGRTASEVLAGVQE